jgi:hypothetical protein
MTRTGWTLARIMFWMFGAGWLLFFFGFFGGLIAGFGLWNDVPFGVGLLLVFVSAPYVNWRLWRWIWRTYFAQKEV